MTTVKVRIAVAVNADGDWQAQGWQYDGVPADDVEMIDDARASLSGLGDTRNSIVCWVEAEVPVPVAPVAPGSVTTHDHGDKG